MKKIAALATAVMLILLCATPALAFGVSPPSIEFDVPAEGSTKVEFAVYDFTGDLQVSLEDIPLKVEPTTVSVAAGDEGTTVELTFYGDKSLGSKIYNGKIRLLAMTGGTVAMGIKVRATVTNLVEGEPPVLASPEESQATATSPEEAPAPSPGEATPTEATPTEATPTEATPTEATPGEEAPPAQTPATTEFPLIPIAGIAAGVVIVITLILVVARRSH